MTTKPTKIEELIAENKRLKEQQKKLEKRIGNQRRAWSETWQIIEDRFEHRTKRIDYLRRNNNRLQDEVGKLFLQREDAYADITKLREALQGLYIWSDIGFSHHSRDQQHQQKLREYRYKAQQALAETKEDE